MPPKRWYGPSASFAFTRHPDIHQVMPGDNVEMVCDLVHDVAAEVGSRYVALASFDPTYFSRPTTVSLYGKAEKPVSLLLAWRESSF